MIDPASIKHVHMLGICGTAMGALAKLLCDLGLRVSGSDGNPYPPMSTQLENLGVRVFRGYAGTNLDDRPDLVIVGNVIRRDNPEALTTLERNIPYISMPQAIAELLIKTNHSVVVAGTHGKTTTSALIAWCMTSAGVSPGFLIGGELLNFDANASLGRPGYFVIEGDEYDTAFFDKGPKFLHYLPQSAIITSVEFDHADIYRDIEHVKSSFRRFLELLPAHGSLVTCTDYEHLRVLLPHSSAPAITYGLRGDSEYSGYVEEAGPAGMRFVVTQSGAPIGDFHTPLVGKHNLLNLIAATIMLQRLGLSLDAIRAGFESFAGVRRRQQVFAEVNGITLIDDFAHHPTAVQVTIEAIRMRFPSRRIWAVFEPRSATSRRNVFQDKYPGAFLGADRVLICDVFNSNQISETERFSPQELVDALRGRGIDADALPDTASIIARIVTEVRPDDVVLVMSNGGFDGIYQKLPAALAATRSS